MWYGFLMTGCKFRPALRYLVTKSSPSRRTQRVVGAQGVTKDSTKELENIGSGARRNERHRVVVFALG